MIRHVVLFKFRENESAAAIAAIEKRFALLPKLIPGIVDFEWGINESPEALNEGYTHCFVVSFEDARARDTYIPHPDHAAFVALLDQHLEKALVIDYAPR